MRHIVILGNGIAGTTAARELRKHTTDRITIISAETDYFFSRTALMYVYIGQLTFQHTKPYEDWFWTKNRIDLVRQDINFIDFNAKKLCWKGGIITYDVLILAAGSQSNLGGWPGEQLQGVQGLYGKPDLDRMEAYTKTIRQAVVVGGGLIGVQLCEMLQARGIPVTFLIRETGFWNSVLPTDESEMVTRHIREHQIDVRTSTEVIEICDDGTGWVGSVKTSTGDVLPAQFVGVAVGVSPAIGFLKETPLNTDQGILVNEFLETNLPDVYAIGGCIQHRIPPKSPGPGGMARKSVEQSWHTGRVMGETVARTIAGKKTAYQPNIFFNSAKFFSIEYQTYGDACLPKPDNQQTFYWEHETESISLRINYQAITGIITGMNALGMRQRQDVWQRWIANGKTIKYVLEHLPQANFEPEFSQQHEVKIIAKYNFENPFQLVTLLRARKGLFGL